MAAGATKTWADLLLHYLSSRGDSDGLNADKAYEFLTKELSGAASEEFMKSINLAPSDSEPRSYRRYDSKIGRDVAIEVRIPPPLHLIIFGVPALGWNWQFTGGKRNIMKFLLTHGADVNKVHEGRTVLDY